jgi:hypothetical protein
LSSYATTTALTDGLAAKAALASSIIQMVSATTTTQLLTTSATYVDTGLSVTITPTKTTSTIVLVISQEAYVEGAGDGNANLQIIRGASTLVHEYARALGCNAPTSISANISMISVDAPATTSAVTYKTQIRKASGSGQVGAQVSSGRSYVLAFELSV